MPGFQRPITIKAAIDNVRNRVYLLPAIQRRFVWSSEKVEALFDSVMRGYPISSFMFWKITDDTVKKEARFYDFLQKFRQHFHEQNSEVETRNGKDFFAVIDGQQRLTALYLGLLGSYAYKLPRVWLKDNEENLPTRYLYLNLRDARGDDDELGMTYDFRFLTEKERPAADKDSPWFKVGDILDFGSADRLDEYLDDRALPKEAKQRLRRLRETVHQLDVINYYEETDQSIDHVLDIFIRTNSGGVPLGYSDLLMSSTTAQWRTKDARAEFDKLVSNVFKVGIPGFIIDKDFILKTCLMLFAESVRFRIGNLSSHVIGALEVNWERASAAVLTTFEFLADIGFHELNLRAKSPVMPIIQYVYLRGAERDFTNPLKHSKDKEAIRMWLCTSVVKGVFRSQPDHLLNSLRKLIHTGATGAEPHFPLQEIRAAFQAQPSRNLAFDDAFVDAILATELGEPEVFPILSLLYSHVDYARQRIDIDHLHPAAEIGRVRELPVEKRPADWDFIVASANWNSIANLQPLNESLNRSKQDVSLANWVAAQGIDRQAYLLPSDVSLELPAFKEFIEKRRTLLAARLREVIDPANA